MMSNKILGIDVIKRWLNDVDDEDWSVRRAAINACIGRTDIPVEIIERGLKDEDWDVRCAAMNACAGRTDILIETIERGLKDEDWDVRCAAMNACAGRTDILIETIERWLNDEDWDVRCAAMNACAGRTDILIETIERWLNDENLNFRYAAMNACIGRTDIPIETIERGLKDNDCDVRRVAMKVCKENGIDVPIIRTIEPPEKVYKKCLGNVIVVATIPKEAQVRGSLNGKCRADKAKIVDIIGTFGGEKVGISSYDNKTTYFIGDEIAIDDFDLSNEECSTGFHFFCDKSLAENY